MVPTDKTNNFTTVATEDYIRWVKEELSKTAQEVPRCYVKELHEDAEEFLKQIDFLLSEREREFIEEALFLKAIPQPQLLVKDHKAPDANGDFPTRLVIPETNFTAVSLKLGYMSIKKILDDHGVNYAKHTIVQSADLKEKLEACNLKMNNVTLMSLDIVNMYP